MAHFAELDETNIVIRVVVVDDALGDEGGKNWCESRLGGRWIQCSYNNHIRKQFPGPGFRYDEAADVFVAPQPFPSWSLDANHDWQPPTPRPQGAYRWDEPTLAWVPL